MAAVHVQTVVNPGSSANEIVAASVVHLQHVRTDGPMAQEEWNNAAHLRHFSAVRKLDNQPFPAGVAGGWVGEEAGMSDCQLSPASVIQATAAESPAHPARPAPLIAAACLWFPPAC